ncbi:uncharacterized protein DUF1080 [Thermosporothrix hazakensis]|jgi:hypothetical protein|uniref:Uncharacterized protein DUF1080 n=2 Tax=Thermosporothrix TaxID=768650 RepID=A0A326TZH9_THEHA|nr:family 16 glycoside hydrolase [Thermosporothrix hazakensis]PZW22968.1 uncharacterized protein DUF1080 [Thermosporothrix hazakensis]BBH90060.1 hypothetical protein KTC_48110 [Thermosporothrix sp. COM3]GCE48281.1 hypothetical protein KTH_31500 [Thermosporothrix hazakensis]
MDVNPETQKRQSSGDNPVQEQSPQAEARQYPEQASELPQGSREQETLSTEEPTSKAVPPYAAQATQQEVPTTPSEATFRPVSTHKPVIEEKGYTGATPVEEVTQRVVPAQPAGSVNNEQTQRISPASPSEEQSVVAASAEQTQRISPASPSEEQQQGSSVDEVTVRRMPPRGGVQQAPVAPTPPVSPVATPQNGPAAFPQVVSVQQDHVYSERFGPPPEEMMAVSGSQPWGYPAQSGGPQYPAPSGVFPQQGPGMPPPYPYGYQQPYRQQPRRSPGKTIFLACCAVLVLVLFGSLIFAFFSYQAQVTETNNKNATATSVVQTATAVKSTYPFSTKLVLNQPLNKNEAEWDVNGDCAFQQDGYHVHVKSDAATFCGESKQFSNFTYEITAKLLEGSWAGIYFRANVNGGKLYAFLVSSKGYNIIKGMGVYSDIILLASGDSVPSFQQNGENKISVVAEGESLQFYVNGTLVNRMSDSSHTNGRIGVMSITNMNEATAEVVYSNAKVWEL